MNKPNSRRRSPLGRNISRFFLVLIIILGAAGAADSSDTVPSWNTVDRLVSEQKFQAAVDEVARI